MIMTTFIYTILAVDNVYNRNQLSQHPMSCYTVKLAIYIVSASKLNYYPIEMAFT